jgi:putative ATPase
VGAAGHRQDHHRGLISAQTGRRFVELSAVSAGVKDVREVLTAARRDLARGERETVLFVDEVHRFSKAQQDALLPGVENRWVSLVAPRRRTRTSASSHLC